MEGEAIGKQLSEIPIDSEILTLPHVDNLENEGIWSWSWGAGTHGQLATRAFRDQLLPQPLLDFASFPVQSMACGGSHAAAVSKTGEAASWGNGQSGQLGHGHAENCSELTFVKALGSIKIRSVSAGWSHTAFVSEDQKLFTCGSGTFGQLGHGNFKSCKIPIRVAEFESMQVLMAACGMRHTLVLINLGENSAVYAFGSSKHGQLGIELAVQNTDKLKRGLKSHCICIPQNVTRLNRHSIVSIHSNGDHSAALNDCGVLYLWGRGYNGVLDVMLPTVASHDRRFCQVALGWNHLLALTDDGLVYACGCNLGESLNAPPHLSSNWSHKNQGILALTAPRESKSVSAKEDSYIFRLHEVEPLKEYRVRWVAAGSEHSAVALDDGTVMTWGWGEHGQLGLGTTSDQSIPQKVSIRSRMNGLKCRIYCGSGFTFVCMAF